MNKKAIAILGAIFLLIVGTLGFLIYSKYFNKPADSGDSVVQQPPPDNTSPSPSPPDPGTSPSPNPNPGPSFNVAQLTSDQVVSPVLFFNGEGINYFDNRGNLFAANFQDDGGQLTLTGKKQLNIPTKTNLVKVIWPAQGKDFIAQLKDSAGKISYSYFDSDTAAFTDLPPQVGALDWMPDGSRIMFIWQENGKATLGLGNPDTTNYIGLVEMWETDDAIFVSPKGDQILYYQTTNTSGTNAISSLTSDGKVWKGLVNSGQNNGVLWSPDGQKFLFGKKDVISQKYQLWVYNFSSGEVKNLGLNTVVDKALWDKDSNTIYASVPNSGNAGEGGLTVDAFIRIDANTLQKKEYSILNAAVDGRDLFLNNLGDKLFFKNAQDGGLYYLDLAK